MNLYEIDRNLLALVDEETGEIRDYDAFMSLQMDKQTKIENCACWIKDLKAEAKAIREEEKALADRRNSAERRAEKLTAYIEQFLAGETFKTARCSIGYRRSSSVELDDGFVDWCLDNGRDDLLSYKKPEASKTAIGDYLKNGGELDNARIVEKFNMSIK